MGFDLLFFLLPRVFLMIVLISLPIHIPLNYWCIYYIYVGIIGPFEQSIKTNPQNPQIPTYVVKFTRLVIDTIGFSVIISSKLCT